MSLANATVSVLGADIRVTTGANGRFRILELTFPGRCILVVHRLG